ncbi:MAG TPA: ferritin family protein [Methanomicrobiales archaeon]|nr:ferritin family protein [Methanomicrobiales archaeon]
MNQEEFKKIISMAIDREVESYTYYKSISDKVKDANLKKLFGELAEDEKGHRALLQNYLSKDFKTMHFSAAKDYKVADTLQSPKLTADMKPTDGLILAIKKELEAMQMYMQFANLTTDAEQKMVFKELANMERGHKARLEDIYTDMAFPEVW